MRLFTFTTVGIALVVSMLAAGIIVVCAASEQPGETWKTASLLFAHSELRLLRSGRYVLRNTLCDLCSAEQSQGDWSESNDLVTLVPQRPDMLHIVLERSTSKDGCPVLVPLSATVSSAAKEAEALSNSAACPVQH